MLVIKSENRNTHTITLLNNNKGFRSVCGIKFQFVLELKTWRSIGSSRGVNYYYCNWGFIRKWNHVRLFVTSSKCNSDTDVSIKRVVSNIGELKKCYCNSFMSLFCVPFLRFPFFSFLVFAYCFFKAPYYSFCSLSFASYSETINGATSFILL